MDCPEVTQQEDVAWDCNLGSTSWGAGVYMGSLSGAGKGSTEGMLSSLLQPWASGAGPAPGDTHVRGILQGEGAPLHTAAPWDPRGCLGCQVGTDWCSVNVTPATHPGPEPLARCPCSPQHRDGRTGVTGVTGSCDIHSAQRQNRRGHGDHWGGPWGTYKWGLASPLPHPQPGGESAQVPSTLGTVNNLQGSPGGPHPG